MTTTPDIPALRALLEKATQYEPVITRWEQMDALRQFLDAGPALLDAAEERDRLKRALSLAVSRGCDHCSESIGEARKIASECGV